MHRLTAEADRDYVGQTMGMDDSQNRFATRLQAGEALVYSDALSETVHVAVERTLTSTRPKIPQSTENPPFRGCAACRAQCKYRGPALALITDARLLDSVRTYVRDLERLDASEEEDESNWRDLIGVLTSQVRRFAALPDDGSRLSDASYCLFLHALATQRTHFAESWATAAAEILGIEPVSMPTPRD